MSEGLSHGKMTPTLHRTVGSMRQVACPRNDLASTTGSRRPISFVRTYTRATNTHDWSITQLAKKSFDEALPDLTAVVCLYFSMSMI